MIEGLSSVLPRGLRVLRFGVPLVACASALAWGLWTYVGEVQSVRQETVRNADLVRQYTERLVQTQTIVQHAVRSRAEREPAEFLSSEAFHRFLQDIETAQPFTEAVTVIGTDGRLIASSRAYPVTAGMAADDYHASVRQVGTIFLDRSRLAPGQGDVLVVATPFAAGTTRGAIVSAISIGLIRGFLSRVANDPGEAASLLREDGRLLVRNVPSEPMQLPPDAAAFAAIRAADSGTFETVAASDQVKRIYSYARVGTLPLFANFGSPSSSVLTNWLARVLPVWTLVAAISCLTFLMARQIERSMTVRFQAVADRRRLAEAERLAEQRRQLMNEMNHRVKNSLALVAALIGLQMRNQGTINGAELQARVMAISEVHELLHRSHDSEHIDFGDILTRLCASPAIIPGERAIRVVEMIESGVIVSPDHATALALSTAEVLTNAVKHAFAGRAPGEIRVSLRRDGRQAVLEISDDGVGLPAVLSRSSGLRIVDGLVAQVGGTHERFSDQGTRVRITFPLSVVPSEPKGSSAADEAAQAIREAS